MLVLRFRFMKHFSKSLHMRGFCPLCFLLGMMNHNTLSFHRESCLIFYHLRICFGIYWAKSLASRLCLIWGRWDVNSLGSRGCRSGIMVGILVHYFSSHNQCARKRCLPSFSSDRFQGQLTCEVTQLLELGRLEAGWTS